MKYILLTKGFKCKVDDDDFAKYGLNSWYANLWNKKGGTKYYAERSVWKNGQIKHQILHRLITSAKKGEIVDHINGDTLDNRKSNLRLTNSFENQQNRVGPNKNNKLRTKGVSYVPRLKKFQVHICRNGIKKYLGVFTTKKEAEITYNTYARNL